MYINDSSDKKKATKPAVPTITKYPVTNKMQCKSATKFTGSRNDVFRFTSVPKPVNTTCNLLTKNSVTVQKSHKETTQPETIVAITTGNLHHHNYKLRYIS